MAAAVLAGLLAQGASAAESVAAATAAGFDAPQPALNLQPPAKILLGDERAQARAAAQQGCVQQSFSSEPTCPASTSPDAGGVHPAGPVTGAGPNSAAGAAKMGGALAVLEGAAALLQGD